MPLVRMYWMFITLKNFNCSQTKIVVRYMTTDDSSNTPSATFIWLYDGNDCDLTLSYKLWHFIWVSNYHYFPSIGNLELFVCIYTCIELLKEIKLAIQLDLWNLKLCVSLCVFFTNRPTSIQVEQRCNFKWIAYKLRMLQTITSICFRVLRRYTLQFKY